MRKHVLLFFLSKVTRLNDKPFENLDDAGDVPQLTNETALRWLMQNVAEPSKIFILASKEVREQKFGELTHIEHFKARMKKFLPHFDDLIETIEYDEDRPENLLSVTKLSRAIEKYVSEQNGDEVHLHVDLTSGPRNVGIIILDVVRLMHYSGLKIGRLLYSNIIAGKGRVEEVDDIYDLFQMISGAEEFVQFGSVKALKDYYDRHYPERSAALDKLLGAMENFSEEIKLCHYGRLQRAIERLHDAVRDFESDGSESDELMARLIGRIRTNYAELISTRDRDDLKIIRRCLENDYMQQALTLYTERIPEYLGEKGIVEPAADEIGRIQKEAGNDNRNFWFYFLNNYKSESYKKANEKYDQIVAELAADYNRSVKSDALEVLDDPQKNFDCDEWFGQVEELSGAAVEKLREADVPIESGELVIKDETYVHRLLELLKSLKQNPKPLTDLSATQFEPLRNLFDELKDRFESPRGKWGKARFQIILEALKKLKEKPMKKYFSTLEFRGTTTMFRIKYMLRRKEFSLTIDDETFLSIMDKYFRLKNERNQTNHARLDSGEFQTAEALTKVMTEGLEEIEEAMKRRVR